MSISSSPVVDDGNTGSTKRLADYEPLAKVCSSFLLDLFSPQSSSAQNHHDNNLPYFIAMAFSLSQLPDTNALAALTLLQRLKSRHPTRTLSSPVPKRNEAERLFLSSYIAATKVLSDDRYRLQFWVQVGQNKFAVEELGQMEKELFEELDWDVRIDDATLAIFQLLILRRKQVQEGKGRQHQGLVMPVSRSDSTESSSSSGSTESSSSWLGSSQSSSASSFPTTPPDSAAISPIIQQGMLRMKESEQNLATIDERIEALEQRFDSLLQKPATPSQDCTGKSHHGTRHMLKEKILHAFRT